MKVLIRGKAKKLCNRDVRHALRFFASHLFKKSPRVEIRVTFKPIKDKAEVKHDPNFPDVFNIDVREDLSASLVRRALAHELTHVRQYITGSLYDYQRFPNTVKWQGERYSFKSDSAGVDYWLSPWEIEANGTEHGLDALYRKERRRLARKRRRARLSL